MSEVDCQTCYPQACYRLLQQIVTSVQRQVATSLILTHLLLQLGEIDKFCGNLLTSYDKQLKGTFTRYDLSADFARVVSFSTVGSLKLLHNNINSTI